MGFPRQPDDDVDPEQDPQSLYAAPTIRRSSDRGSTQPLETPPDSGLPRGSGMQVDGADFATRSHQRRQRQAGAQIYTQRIGEVAQRFDNRSLLAIGGAILLILALLLIWRVMSRDAGASLGTDLEATTQAVDETAPVYTDPANPFATVAPAVDPGTGIGTEPVAVPTAGGAGGGAFVVAGTGTEGLFLRSAGVSDPANILATLPEGTEVTATGEETNDGTRTWKRVQTPQGEGWVAADFLVPRP